MSINIFKTILLVCVAAVSARGQLVLKNEDVSFRFGIQGQFWANWAQDPVTQGYSQNLYLRRGRLIVGGDIGHDLSFFFETDNPNLGKMPKALNAGFIIQDAFLEYKVHNAFRVDGGLMLVPLSRNALQSPASYYTLDISPVTTASNVSTQSSALRDAGFGAKGFFLQDKLQYRLGLFQGMRAPTARNSLRTAGYLQYDFFETETAYTFPGTALGRKKILAVDGGFDTQGAYRAWSGNVAADIPVRGGDEIGGQFLYMHYDGRNQFISIPRQDGYMAELAYYLHTVKFQPFARLESQRYAAAGSKDVDRYGAGVNRYIRGQSLKWTLQYQRAFAKAAAGRAANEFSMQLQLFYF